MRRRRWSRREDSAREARRAEPRPSSDLRELVGGGGRGDSQPIAGAQMRTFAQLIPAGERSHRDAVALGDASHGLPRLDYMDPELDGWSAVRLELPIVNPGLGKALRGSEWELQEIGSPGRCLLVPELRVELPESVQAQAGERRHPRQLHALGYRSQL